MISSSVRLRKVTNVISDALRHRRILPFLSVFAKQRPVTTICVRPESLRNIKAASSQVFGLPKGSLPNKTNVSAAKSHLSGNSFATARIFLNARSIAKASGSSTRSGKVSSTSAGQTSNGTPICLSNCCRRGDAETRTMGLKSFRTCANFDHLRSKGTFCLVPFGKFTFGEGQCVRNLRVLCQRFEDQGWGCHWCI